MWCPQMEERRLMKKLRIELELELDEDIVEEDLNQGWSRDAILGTIENHIKGAIGNNSIEGWGYIRDIDVLSIEVE